MFHISPNVMKECTNVSTVTVMYLGKMIVTEGSLSMILYLRLVYTFMVSQGVLHVS